MTTPRSQQPRRPQRTGMRRGQPVRPLPRGNTFFTPGAGTRRHTVERSSARSLVVLHQLPRWLPPVVLLALLITGFTLRGWAGAGALVAVAAVLGWLAYVSWPALGARGRVLRAAGIACVLALAVIQARR